jgi:hypothetical protein
LKHPARAGWAASSATTRRCRPLPTSARHGAGGVEDSENLIASGALLPAYLFDAKFDLAACRDETGPIEKLTEVMTDVTIDDAGKLAVSCGGSRYEWSASSYPGDMLQRLDALLGPGR